MSEVNLGIWNTLTRVVTGLFLVAGLLALAVWYLPVIHKNEKMRKEILRLDGQLAKEDAAAKELKASIDAQRNDPKSVERLAREKLGYAKPGETVIRFEEVATNRSALN
jgi:cell division protein FtsB